MHNMAQVNVPMLLQFKNSALFGIQPNSFVCFQTQSKSITKKPLVIEARARANTRKESAKIRNRRMQKKMTKIKKCLLYGSTLQKSFRQDPPCSTLEAAHRVGEALVKACVDLNISEISSYDHNGLHSSYGFLPR
ncbi:uncharacterized protein LOC114411318 isoform X2 [Glycine soja]|uniref:uncharacterized protein LOC114411318 isoform X2 n=1 Tax=Glycine soja TaxID=3848 RepID=UPI00103A2290|nr:uncharacterized protein LOC114411318 isoform X2 [Glycine soja]